MSQITLNTKKPYSIEIKKGLIINQGLLEGFLVTDTNLAKIYPKIMKKDSLVLFSGEENKSFENYLRIVYFLDHSDKLIALGGGVIGDLAGFVASTYKRGINLIQIPTSLTAMVDSSVGGKNGINIVDRKNYLGTIYQPEKVLIDPLFLNTLPKKEFTNGLAEVIKYSFIFNTPPIERIKSGVSVNDTDLEDIIFQCCETKARVIEKDEQDKAYRHTLNFGHTIGHAIELSQRLSHGQAVSIGMIKEAELGYNLGIVDKNFYQELKQALSINGLNTKLPANLDVDKTLEIMESDKKGKFIFAFNQKNHSVKVNPEEIIKCLKNDN
jgi:3-dehydroquinate synthase